MAIISDDDFFNNKNICDDKCKDIKPEVIDFDKSLENNIRQK